MSFCNLVCVFAKGPSINKLLIRTASTIRGSPNKPTLSTFARVEVVLLLLFDKAGKRITLFNSRTFLS